MLERDAPCCPDSARSDRTLKDNGHLCLANCYFAHNSLGFPALLPFFNASFPRPFHPLNRHPDPVAPTWRRPFPHCRVPSAQTPTPDPESLPTPVLSSRCVIASESSSHRSSKTYSCCASRMVKVRLGPDPTTNSKPIAPGTVVIKEIVPSGFLRELTSLFHSPKSKMVEVPDLLTAISPSEEFA
jgi:hypothetical protein